MIAGAPARLREERARLQLSQVELGKAGEVSKNTQLAYEGGNSSIPLDYLEKVALHGVDPLYVVSGVRSAEVFGSKIALISDADADPDDDVVAIDNIDLSFGLGGTFLDSDTVEVEKIAFSQSWLRQFTNAPPHLLFSTRGLGNSMEPTINDRDVVIVDKSVTRLDQSPGEKYWAVSFGGVGMIKRLRPMPDGTVKILSDNQLVSPEVASDGELFIIGRVCAIVRSV